MATHANNLTLPHKNKWAYHRTERGLDMRTIENNIFSRFRREGAFGARDRTKDVYM